MASISFHPLTVDRIVYLDVEYVSLKCEELTGTSPSSVLTKTEGGRADLGISVLKAGIHTQESRSYSLSSFGMLQEINHELSKIGELTLEAFNSGAGSKVGWVDGNLTLGAWSNPKTGERQEIFELISGKRNLSLLAKSEYFYPGIGGILGASQALKLNVDLPVRMLGKVHYYVEGARTFVVTPLVISE